MIVSNSGCGPINQIREMLPWSGSGQQEEQGIGAGNGEAGYGQDGGAAEAGSSGSAAAGDNLDSPLSGGVEETVTLPERYDYREHGRCPAVGSQGDLGTCWAFASMAALQSALLPEEAWDFSEDHLSIHNSFGMDQNMGGDYTMAMAYFLAWQGPVTEAQDPYGDGVSPEGLTAVKHVQEIRIPAAKDYDAIKRAVYFHGGVQTSIYTDMTEGNRLSDYYEKSGSSYYYPTETEPNHDVVIMGWDDSYPRERFVTDPGMDGAFLCMNSWGTDFGESGLFYVSYADPNIGVHNLVYTGVEEADNYDRIYQDDLCGWLGQLGYEDETAWFSAVYEAGGEEQVAAVGFYATGPDTEYEIYQTEITEDGPVTGARLAQGSVLQAGFYTVRLENGQKLSAGERFSVAIKIRTPKAKHPVAVEYGGSQTERAAVVDLSDGEGYISADGRLWSRTEPQQSNVCLKIYTNRR